MTNCAERFAACIEDLLLYKAVADPVVARAMVLMSRRYGESDLRSKVATAVGASTTALNRSFERALGVTLVEYLKDLRLRRAAELLHSTHKRIKEIWVEVGYNDDSNFNHDFKEKFGLSPTNYRTRAICVSPIMRSEEKAQAPPKRDEAARVLLVDDDVEGVTIVARYLTIEGYAVAIASNAEEAVKEAMRFAPHVVLLDHRLGAGADGIECLHALRREQLSRQPAVALVTGDWDVTSRTNELQNLNATLLFKPCDVEMIQALVARLAA